MASVAHNGMDSLQNSPSPRLRAPLVALAPEQAPDVWTELAGNERLFEIEGIPGGIETYLKANVTGQTSPSLWTDAWLAALAEAWALQRVSFDRALRRFKLTSLEILEIP
jgi:predicted nucleic acid-binding protein